MTDDKILTAIDKYGLDWSKVMGAPLFVWRNTPRLQFAWLALRGLTAMIFRRLRLPPQFDCDLLFFKSIQRRDYQIFFDRVVETCRASKVCLEVTYGYGPDLQQIRIFASELRYLSEFWRATNGDGLGAIYLYCNFVRCLSLLAGLRGSKFNALVVFGDMYLFDNFLAQYSRQRGRKTATMQHGLYIDTTANRTNINYINYSNVVSDYFLAWGEDTARLVSSYAPSTTPTIVGKPVELGPKHDLPTRKNGTKYMAIILDSHAFKAHNDQLLKIGHDVARRLDLKIMIKFHPDNIRSAYTVDATRVLDAPVTHAEFAIGHITTFLYEMMRMGMRVYKLRSHEPTHDLPEQLCFSTAGELLSKLDLPFDFSRTAEYFIKYVSDQAAAKYSDFFKNWAVSAQS